MHQLRFLKRYVHYLIKSDTKYNIHSPFLYKLITDVFDDSTIYPEYGSIESLKEKLLQDSRSIEVTDFGAGSKFGNNSRRKISQIVRNSSRPAKYGRLLFRLSRYLQPLTILELGTSAGLSSAYLSKGWPSASLHTVEGCPSLAAIASANFELLQLTNYQVIQGRFEEKLPEILSDISQIDLAFIDGNHRYDPTIYYFEQCLAKSVNETCLIFDDIHWSNEMENAWQHIQHNRKVTISVDLFFMGLVFFRKELTKQHFIIRF